MNDLIEWSEIERQIADAKDIETIAAMRNTLDVFDVLAKQKRESLEVRNRIERYRIEIAWAAAQVFYALPDETGKRTDVTSNQDGTKFETTRQAALTTLGVARSTMNRWQESAMVADRDIELSQYEAECNTEDVKLTQEGFAKRFRGSELRDILPTLYIELNDNGVKNVYTLCESHVVVTMGGDEVRRFESKTLSEYPYRDPGGAQTGEAARL